MARSLCLFLVAAAHLSPPASGYIIKRWPLASTLPVEDLTIDGTAQGPAGVSLCLGMKGSNACHDPDSSCNQCRSELPHIFHVTWCADTRGYVGISCDLDLGYRSAQGAREGHFQYSLAGLRSSRYACVAVWVYCILWFLVQDVAKVLTYSVLNYLQRDEVALLANASKMAQVSNMYAVVNKNVKAGGKPNAAFDQRVDEGLNDKIKSLEAEIALMRDVLIRANLLPASPPPGVAAAH
jgi:hypothetical protein